MKNIITKLVIIAFTASALLLSSCLATVHTVGKGGKANGKAPSNYDASAKRMYLFWGLLPLNNPDSQTMAGGAENYTIRTTTTFVDYLISIPGSWLLGFRTQTIRVSTDK